MDIRYSHAVPCDAKLSFKCPATWMNRDCTGNKLPALFSTNLYSLPPLVLKSCSIHPIICYPSTHKKPSFPLSVISPRLIILLPHFYESQGSSSSVLDHHAFWRYAYSNQPWSVPIVHLLLLENPIFHALKRIKLSSVHSIQVISLL
jgi:hypothetical protein